LQAGGHRFDPDRLHQVHMMQRGFVPARVAYPIDETKADPAPSNWTAG
jgi:hypothetical protein